MPASHDEKRLQLNSEGRERAAQDDVRGVSAPLNEPLSENGLGHKHLAVDLTNT